MSAILLDLQARFSLAWLRNHMIIYADDVHLRWIVMSPTHALEALSELQHILDTFSAFGLKINMQKSFAILRLVGREAPSFLRRWVHRMPDGPLLLLPEKHWRLPLVSKTAYLGVFLSYRAFDFDTTMRRITAAKWCSHNPGLGLPARSIRFTFDLSYTVSVSYPLLAMIFTKWESHVADSPNLSARSTHIIGS